MRGLALSLLCALLVFLGGCGGAKDSGGPAKRAFVTGADDVCKAHVRAVMNWLVQPQQGPSWQQNATQNEGLYEIIDSSIRRLESLGPAPDPHGEAFDGYLGTLKARAALYRLTSVAFLKRDTVFALRLETRIGQIDSQGDHYAHTYGLRVCGTGLKDVAKAFNAAGWTPPSR
jgi:hypothetical protein